jgi:hypothetical protein
MQAPLWVTIAGLIVGPALTAAIVTGIFQSKLTKQKSALDESVGTKLTTLETNLKSRADKDLEEYKSALQRSLREHEAELEDRVRRRVKFEEHVAGLQLALRKCYVLIFEKGRTANPEELFSLTRQGIDMVMEPFRQCERQLRTETKNSILAVTNHLYELIPGGKGRPFPTTIDRFRATRDLFLAMTEQARDTLQDELKRNGGSEKYD